MEGGRPDATVPPTRSRGLRGRGEELRDTEPAVSAHRPGPAVRPHRCKVSEAPSAPLAPRSDVGDPAQELEATVEDVVEVLRLLDRYAGHLVDRDLAQEDHPPAELPQRDHA